MSLEIKGINNLIKKLDNMTNINTESVIQEVAKDKVIKILNESGIKGGRVQEPRKEKDLYNVPIGFKAFKR